MVTRRGRALAVCVVLLVCGGAASTVVAQGWTAQLVLAPLPSPFLSDWEVDPTIGEVLVTNGTAATTDITFHYTLTRNGRQLLRGVTDPQTIAAGATETFNATSSFGGQADWDRDVQDLVARTGRLPEGEFEACVTITDPGGFVLVPRQCLRFSTLYPDPPALVFPFNGDTVTTQDPIFEWLPVQLPPLADGRIGYVLQIAEVNTAARQRPELALASNILHYVEPDLVETSHAYPVGALPLAPGRTYAWRVQALDGDGRPVAANQGRSEVWTFVYRDPAAEVERRVASIALTPRRDTLRYAGDTARFEATAYDADNVEIRGKRMQWRSLDTTIVQVDTLGVVRGVRAGETRIVASADGVADTALSVTAALTGLSVRFERYDPQAAAPALLELLESGSFDDVVPKLMEMLQSGELRIPIPRLPALEGGSGSGGQGGGGGGGGEEGGPRGPAAPSPDASPSRAAVEECGDVSGIAEVHLDRERQVWAIQLGLTALMPCLSPPGGGNETRWVRPPEAPDTAGHVSALLAISWRHPGVPRAFLALKGIVQLPLALPLVGTTATTTYGVLNISRSVTLESALLPADFAEFFGSQSFDAGTGLTIYSKLRCLDDSAALCQLLTGINPDNPEITVHAFAGVTASEASVNLSGVGTSQARGFSIQATLPVRTYDLAIRNADDAVLLSLDSTQVGLLFAVQDSVVTAPNTPTHNWSIGVAPTVSVWVTGSRGNSWQVDVAAGLEWDPTRETETLKPKLVLSAQLAQVWQLWPLRLGNPQLVFTTPIGSRQAREATTLQLSGTWGFGANQGFRVMGTGGGDLPGDVGGGATGGADAFEEFGRGQITFKWERPRTEATRAEQLAKRNALTKEFLAAVHARRDAREKLERAEARVKEARRRYDAQFPATVSESEAAEKAFLEAESEYATANVQVVQLQGEREDARQALGPPKCWRRVKGRCLNWSGSLSFGKGSLVDLFAAIMRAGASEQ